MQVFIDQLSQFTGKTVIVKGWLYNKRSSGSIAFLQIRDGSGFVQAVVSKENLSDSVLGVVESLTQESSLEIKGLVTKHPKKENVFELQVETINLVQQAEEYPITLKEHGPEFLLDNRHLWLRSKKQWALLRIRDTIMVAISEYLHKEKFIRTDTPILTPNACEGTTDLFPVNYFDLGYSSFFRFPTSFKC